MTDDHPITKQAELSPRAVEAAKELKYRRDAKCADGVYAIAEIIQLLVVDAALAKADRITGIALDVLEKRLAAAGRYKGLVLELVRAWGDPETEESALDIVSDETIRSYIWRDDAATLAKKLAAAEADNERLREENKQLLNERTTVWDAFEPVVHLYCLPGAPVVPTFAQMLRAAVNDLLRPKKGTRSPEELFIEHAHDGTEGNDNEQA